MADKDLVYLRDILDNIAILEGFLKGVNKQKFFSDLEKQFAVARCLEIVGEGSGKLSDSFKREHADIDWRGLKSMRNLLIHEYAYVDNEELWQACKSDIPDFKKRLEQILN